MTELNEKQILINQLLTDVAGIDATGQETEVEMVLNKIHQLKKIEDKEVEEAEKNDRKADEVDPGESGAEIPEEPEQ